MKKALGLVFVLISMGWLVACGSAPPPAPAGSASVQLSPASGPPGTYIRVSGVIPAALVPLGPVGSATVCWGGCRGGLHIPVNTVHWSTVHDGHFWFLFQVPLTAWLGKGGVPHALVPGHVTVGIACLENDAGCEGHPELATTFQVTAASPPCAAGAGCAWLSITPSQARPGNLVTVRGWAPLNANLYELTLQGPGAVEAPSGLTQDAKGNLSGSFLLPDYLPGVYKAGLQEWTAPGVSTSIPAKNGPQGKSPATLAISAPYSWTDLEGTTPIVITPEATRPPIVSAAPGGTAALAACYGATLRLSHDAGATWSSLDLTPLKTRAIAESGPSTVPPPPGAWGCSQVLLGPWPGSFFVTLDLLDAQVGGWGRFGFISTDSGQTWTSVPPLGTFAGFIALPGGVGEVFSGRFNTAAPVTTVLETKDGGQSFSSVPLPCPFQGPCVTWGAAPPWMLPGAQASLSVQFMKAGSSTWSSVPLPGETVSGIQELVGLGPKEGVLLMGGSQGLQPAILLSKDGGQSWADVNTPPFPASFGVTGFPSFAFFLPTGGLVAAPGGAKAELLLPGKSAWCPISAPWTGEITTPPVAAGGKMWWQTPTGVEGVPVSDFVCQTP